jgi:hypothetical protein
MQTKKGSFKGKFSAVSLAVCGKFGVNGGGECAGG